MVFGQSTSSGPSRIIRPRCSTLSPSERRMPPSGVLVGRGRLRGLAPFPGTPTGSCMRSSPSRLRQLPRPFLEAGLQRLHDVRHARALRLLWSHDLSALDLGLDDFAQHIGVRVAKLLRVPLVAQAVHQLPGELHLFLGPILARQVEILGRADLIREPHRRQHQGVAHRLQGTQMFTLAQDDRPNAEPSCLAEGIAKEAVHLDRRANISVAGTRAFSKSSSVRTTYSSLAYR